MRDEFTGMLPAAIVKFEELMARLPNPKIQAGYGIHGDENDLRSWGVVCNINCDDAEILAQECNALGITIQQDGSLAYTNGLTIEDFKTYRVNGQLELMEVENA